MRHGADGVGVVRSLESCAFAGAREVVATHTQTCFLGLFDVVLEVGVGVSLTFGCLDKGKLLTVSFHGFPVNVGSIRMLPVCDVNAGNRVRVIEGRGFGHGNDAEGERDGHHNDHRDTAASESTA